MPHNVLAMGTVLAALGAKAAGSGVDPTSFIGAGAAPLSKGMGSVLLSLKAGKAATAAAAPSTSFLANAGDAALGAAGTGAGAAAPAKAAAAAAAAAGGSPGKAGLSLLAAKGSAASGAAAPSTVAGAAGVKGASGAGTAAAANSSMLKVAQKACFRKKKAGLLKGPKHGGAKTPHASGASATAGRHGGSSGPTSNHPHNSTHGTQNTGATGGEHTAHPQPHSTQGTHSAAHGGGEASRASASRGSGFQGPLTGQHGGPSSSAGTNYVGAPPAGTEGGEEIMPGTVGTPAHAKFLQLHKGPTSSTAAFASTSHSSPMPHTVSATPAAAAAAAADHAAGGPAAVAGPAMRAADFGVSPTGGAPGMDPGAFDGAAAAAAAEGPSKGSSMLKGFVEGALGVDSSAGTGGGMLHSLSAGMGQNLFGSWWGGGATAGGAAAALGAAAAADPTGLGAIDPTALGSVDPTALGSVDPADMMEGDPSDLVDPESVGEQTMAVAALLPSLFGRLLGEGKQREDNKNARPTKPQLARRDSLASTACASDGAASDSGNPLQSAAAEAGLTSRRVYRSRVGDRKATYADFLC
ncbi:hypothetical protein, conserved [Eimeria acervulina]|uniref:Uncharacterized protein n=1 Tax=Eimeria acervulina TaxID=5801 RepID=U6GKD4_EIMAC|nr:hypothetical protein, conserved [Eimeria acervulina]CDI79758.1 hypothetical protein, conserved [Eimeria acervulina]